MSIDFKTFRACVPSVLSARFPVLLRGRHGVGKSQVVYQTAADLGLPVVERRASQMTEGDLLGLPDNRDVQVNGRKATTFNPPEWFLTACTEPVCLFLDEVDRATTEVRQGIFELCDSRKIAGNTLHPDTVIIAAVNGGEHGAQYQVGEMDPAELDRYTVFDVEPSHEDWLDWAKDSVDTVLWDFINTNRQHLEHTGDFEPNKVYPSRRSWDRLNQTVTPMGCFSEGGDLDLLFNLTTAFCGFEAAVAVRDFVASYDRQVTVEDILDAGEIDKTADWTINEHSALVEKMEAAETFKPELTDDQIVNLARYFVTLPSEVAMKLWTVLGDGDVQNVIRTHQSTTPEGTVISEHLITILGG